MATYSVGVYNEGLLFGTGTADTAANTITSYSGTAPQQGRNLQIQMRASANVGRSYPARVVTDGGATLTLDGPCPYV